MRQRKELNTLVIAILSSNNCSNPTAKQLYREVKDNKIVRKDGVYSFRSFVKVINSFKEVEHIGASPCLYQINRTLKKI